MIETQTYRLTETSTIVVSVRIDSNANIKIVDAWQDAKPDRYSVVPFCINIMLWNIIVALVDKNNS